MLTAKQNALFYKNKYLAKHRIIENIFVEVSVALKNPIELNITALSKPNQNKTLNSKL
jgi:hypothetical protein